MTRAMLILGSALGVLTVAGLALWFTRSPSGERSWIPEQKVLAAVRMDGSTVHIRNVRNFHYTTRESFTPGYTDRTFDLDRIESAWYVLSPFSERWRGPAHSFVSFGFSDGQFVSVSVEARREVGQSYGVFKGMIRRFELMYVIGEESDLIGQRAAYGTDRVYLYPIRTTPEKMRAMFVSMLERAAALGARPEFYNTVTNNCTSNVVAHVNQVSPRLVSAGVRTILPGYTDAVAMRLGLIDTELDLASARDRFLINERAKQYIHDPAFSLRIRGR